MFFEFYNLIEFETCLTNFKSGLLSFSQRWAGGHVGVSGLYWSWGAGGAAKLCWCGCCGREGVLDCM